jgi:hypothetical protein
MARLSEPRLVLALALLALGAIEGLRAAVLIGVAGPYPLGAHLAFALLALSAGVGLWLRRAWAAAAILALGGVFAATRLIDAFVLGVRPWLFALLAAAATSIITLLLAAWAWQDAHPSPPSRRSAPAQRTATRL